MRFYCLRVVELTYKIIDERLYKNEKMKERIFNHWSAYQSVLRFVPGSLDNACKLYRPQNVTWLVKAPKFEDNETRKRSATLLIF